MKIKVFSSGSSGNCTVVTSNDTTILIDAGISKKMIELNLNSMGLSIKNVDALLITHEHIDHIKAFSMLLKEYHMKIYMTNGTYNAIYSSFFSRKNYSICSLMKERRENNGIFIINRMVNSILYEAFNVGQAHVEVLPTFHDAAESIGFIIHENDKRLVYITDTGYVHQSLYPLINNAEIYVLESNHDPEILMHSDRPYQLKIRILSDHGHISNEDSMVVLANCIGPKTRIIMHAHISQECNLTQIVELTRRKIFSDYGICTDNIKFAILSPRPSEEYDI
ncbi:MAG: MBL fold metallo-hydrolase [Anaeroplasma sp.]